MKDAEMLLDVLQKYTSPVIYGKGISFALEAILRVLEVEYLDTYYEI